MLRHGVSDRKQAVTSQQSELEQLEARIRETEARLREKAVAAGVALEQGENNSARTESSNKRGGLDGVFTPPPEPEKQSNGARRPQTGHGRKQSTSSGAKRK
jgi:hypothetical protein